MFQKAQHFRWMWTDNVSGFSFNFDSTSCTDSFIIIINLKNYYNPCTNLHCRLLHCSLALHYSIWGVAPVLEEEGISSHCVWSNRPTFRDFWNSKWMKLSPNDTGNVMPYLWLLLWLCCTPNESHIFWCCFSISLHLVWGFLSFWADHQNDNPDQHDYTLLQLSSVVYILSLVTSYTYH